MPKIHTSSAFKNLEASKDVSRKFVKGLIRNNMNGFCSTYIEGVGVDVSGNYGDAENFAQLVAGAVACAADDFDIPPTLLLTLAACELPKVRTPNVKNDPLIGVFAEAFDDVFKEISKEFLKGGEQT